MFRDCLQAGSGSGLKLGGTALLVALVLGGVHSLSAERIAEQMRAAERRSLHAVLPAAYYDNDLLTESFLIGPANADFSGLERLGLRAPARVYPARLGTEPSGVILPLTARDGYSGDIRLLVGILADGSISGVRVLGHTETPGLGDRIEIRISDWILGFDRRSLENTPSPAWTVRRYGGDFDQFTGATVTPAAVSRAVYNALQFFADNQEALFRQ